jgi:hypothetical protein
MINILITILLVLGAIGAMALIIAAFVSQDFSIKRQIFINRVNTDVLTMCVIVNVLGKDIESSLATLKSKLESKPILESTR